MAYRGSTSSPISAREILHRYGIDFNKVKKNKNFDAIVAGCELGYLKRSDVVFMLEESTSEVQAQNRLTKRRREYYGD